MKFKYFLNTKKIRRIFFVSLLLASISFYITFLFLVTEKLKKKLKIEMSDIFLFLRFNF